MARQITVRGEGLVLDAILAAVHDPATARDILTETLEANPGLSVLGPVLPIGTVINVPDRPVDRVATRPVINLFG
ncbi:tail protein X [Aurantimonas coralicida]|uniref:tail protein X n=1 Tax=Aurantimonas coralicida TaxID=182270 RepID=UPI001E3AC2E2|nr:tail protein X [Aurantimonas coralicida]MCD1644340.1 tail protein X [Aurantimonas coralicida]